MTVPPRLNDRKIEIETEGSTLDRFMELSRRILGASREEVRLKEEEFKKEQKKKREMKKKSDQAG